MNYKDYFKGKKIAVIGLGPHGEMVADLKFLLRLDAQVSLYDMRSERRLGKHLIGLKVQEKEDEKSEAAEEVLKEVKNIKRLEKKSPGLYEWTLGKVPAEKLLDADLILLSPEISRKALFLKKAVQAGIPIEYPDILFLKLAPSITLIGIMGACGKTTAAHLIHSMLKLSFSEYEDQGLFFIDPDSDGGSLVHLKKIKPGDVVLARIPEEMMREYHAIHTSPHVAVITSLTSSAIQEVRGAFDILEFQTYNNFVVASDVVVDSIKKQVNFTPKAKIFRTRGDVNALAIQTAELFKVPAEISQKIIQEFSGLKGRQELVRKVGNIEYYNDAASVTPQATLAALQKLSAEKNIILIFGGAYTGYDYTSLIKQIPLYAHTVILIPGSATLGFRDQIERLYDIAYKQAPDLEEAVKIAQEIAKKGDRILFSPGCEAIGIDSSRKERGERFQKIVKKL